MSLRLAWLVVFVYTLLHVPAAIYRIIETIEKHGVWVAVLAFFGALIFMAAVFRIYLAVVLEDKTDDTG